MLAATQKRADDTLGTVKLALKLASNRPISDPTLRSYLLEQLRAALQVVERPYENAPQASPVSILIALSIMGNEVAKNSVEAILQNGEACEEHASLLLEHLEGAFDAEGQPAHLSREVYAAI